jgi:hypothetical protein
VPNLDIYFYGEFSKSAQKALISALPIIVFRKMDDDYTADYALIDRMSDFKDIEVCDFELVERVMGRSKRTVYLASGFTVPVLPKGVVCLGYQPRRQSVPIPDVYWGQEYAPVSVELLSYAALPRDKHSALLAFGGAVDDSAPLIASQVLAASSEIARVNVLCSPVNDDEPRLKFRSGQKVSYLRNVPTVGPLLAQSGVVIASFGNLSYEALALGAPLCLLATKKFQKDLADSFAQLNVATTAGLLSESSLSALTIALQETLDRADELSRNARVMVDGRGIERIAALLLDMPII